MAQAIMDPEQVRRFAEELHSFNADLQNRMSALQSRFAALGETWKDQEHAEFAEEFAQTVKALRKFIEISGRHTPYLLRKARRIEEYLNQH
ncbi:MAG: WXG100 family type VII secretion target [Verrucomicrobiota bacterium]